MILRIEIEKLEANRIVNCFREHGQSRSLPHPQRSKPRSHCPQNGSRKCCVFSTLLLLNMHLSLPDEREQKSSICTTLVEATTVSPPMDSLKALPLHLSKACVAYVTLCHAHRSICQPRDMPIEDLRYCIFQPSLMSSC